MNTYRLKGTSGAVINQSWPLAERQVLGGGTDCDICIDKGADQGPVAEITVADGRILLAAVKDSPVYVNGDAVVEASLNQGDEIRIDRCRFIVQAPGLKPDRVLGDAATAPRRAAWPWLLLVAGAAGAALAWYQGWLPF